MKHGNVIEGLFTYRLHILKKQTDRAINEAFSNELGLSLSEARVLLGAGSFGPQSVSDLGRVSNLDRSQASRATDVLLRKGLIAKASHATDGRGVVVTLTPLGRSTFRRAAAIAKRCNETILATLAPAEQRTLSALLGKLIDGTGWGAAEAADSNG
jgi:DNA-binding MarR family transcriptional regulator